MIELIILALSYINIIDATVDNDIHIYGVIPDAIGTETPVGSGGMILAGQKVELWATYRSLVSSPPSTYCMYDGNRCEGGLKMSDVNQPIASTRTDENGAFSLSAPAISASGSPIKYSIVSNGHTQSVTLISNSFKQIAKSYSNNQTSTMQFGKSLSLLVSNMDKRSIMDEYKHPLDTVVIPEWFKNTASHWTDQKISNSEFLDAVNYLIKKHIIVMKYRE